MDSSPVTPMLALSVTSYANNWYNTGDATDIKPLLFGGIAAVILAGIGTLPGAEPAATLLGWAAFIGFLLSSAQNPSPIQNLVKITGGAKK